MWYIPLAGFRGSSSPAALQKSSKVHRHLQTPTCSPGCWESSIEPSLKDAAQAELRLDDGQSALHYAADAYHLIDLIEIH
jgi:hypothetical protein